MNTIVKISIISLLMAFIVGCSSNPNETIVGQEIESSENEVEKKVILASFYATQEITKKIVGDNFEVKSIIPIGVELHEYEPKPSQLVDASKTNVYISIGGMFEHLEEEILEVANSNINVIDASKGLQLVEGSDDHDHHDKEHHDEEHHDEEHHDEHNHGDLSYDPHVWLSIQNMIIITQNIEKELSQNYPKLSQEFSTNAQAYISQLKELQLQYESKLSSCLVDVALVNHKAFGYLAQEFGFEQVSAAGFSYEQEPSAKEIEHLIEEAREHNVSVIFSEGGVSERVSQTIAREVGAEVLPLYPFVVSEEDSYISIMNTNLDHLAKGLKCN